MSVQRVYKSVRRKSLGPVAWLFDRLGYRIEPVDKLNCLEPLLYRRLAKAPNFFFVQIGANDGKFVDPIWNFVTRNRVAGLVVEPLKDMFDKLRANYRAYPNVTPVNTAIHATLRSVDLYRVDPARAGSVADWAQGIASVKRSRHAAAGVPAEVMITETVSGVTLEELLEQHHVGAIDLLQIDTEGYDAEIIRMIDFARRTPAIICFEHGLPEGIMTAAEFKACVDLLMDHGYLILTEDFDAVAYRPEMI